MPPTRLKVTEESPKITITEKDVTLNVIDGSPVLKVSPETVSIKIDEKDVRVLSKGFQGPVGPEGDTGAQGPQGPQGIQGPQGPQGNGNDSNYVHNQLSPSAVWTITHNLNKYVSVVVVDSADSVVVGDITYVDTNTIIITFSAPFSGRAFIN